MATQQVLFAETIAGMKKAFKRKAYESDSDSEIEKYGNRGQKLKRKARLSHRGQLVPADGIGSYNESVEYAGVRRSIIHRNLPLVDEEGYEIDSDDDEARIEEALAAAMELNPYANINLDNILAPLTASTDLPTHPTLSKPFTSQKLTDLAFQSSMMLRRENHSLWRVRHLWTSLCGDYTWAPCQMMLGPNDSDLFTDDHVAQHLLNLSKPKGQGNSGVSTPATVTAQARNDDAEATTNSVDQSREIVPLQRTPTKRPMCP
uniref:Transcriptional regulatory protein RXT2 N-terminal domain-containing protein n=1 Tax=Bionectria ochroleuca TaxID=29856 RepID=A0A8H7NFH5_BIOOC